MKDPLSMLHLQNLSTEKLLDIGPGKSSWPHILSTCGYDVKAIDKIDSWLGATSFKIIDQEYYKVFSGDFRTMGERITPCLKGDNTDLHHLTYILHQKKG